MRQNLQLEEISLRCWPKFLLIFVLEKHFSSDWFVPSLSKKNFSRQEPRDFYPCRYLKLPPQDENEALLRVWQFREGPAASRKTNFFTKKCFPSCLPVRNSRFLRRVFEMSSPKKKHFFYLSNLGFPHAWLFQPKREKGPFGQSSLNLKQETENEDVTPWD